ncbi:hypothetical protein DSL72_000423 [Monilinia vaccinii-corymbosi]|uniref:Major facilitator superfamily (MFS) profile domain-containing protein n=1 Tax=Monilinia vaccinii-corymbosi TaxID=61207 RepID=A0A8A3NYX1_9HELO|nr:hypothetical protein DSL72_000423 [Monilinia vaccinii-corymbosi]
MALLGSPKSPPIVTAEVVDLPIPSKESELLSPTTKGPETGPISTSTTSPSSTPCPTSLSPPTPTPIPIRKSPLSHALTILSSFTLTLSTWGFYNSTGILLSHLSTTILPQTPLPTLSLIPALNILLTLLLFLPLGPIYDTYGPLPLLIPGSLIYILSILLLSFCSSLLHFLLVYGVLSALGMALLCTVANATLNVFQETGYRGLATGIALVGNPAGGILFTFVFKAVLGNLEWGDAMRVVAGVVGVLVALGFLAFVPFRARKGKGNVDVDMDGDGYVDRRGASEMTRAPRWKFWHEKKIEGDWALLRDKRFLWGMAGISRKHLHHLDASPLLHFIFSADGDLIVDKSYI